MEANTSLRFSELFAATSVRRQNKNLKEETKCSDFFTKALLEGVCTTEHTIKQGAIQHTKQVWILQNMLPGLVSLILYIYESA